MNSARTMIRGAWVIDGTGREPFRSDVLLEEGKIKHIGEVTASGARIIAGEGLWLTPGFIDPHSHSDFTTISHPGGESKLFQGVTTEGLGNCGSSAFPLKNQKLFRVRSQNPALEINWEDLPGYRQLLSRNGHTLNLFSLTGQGNIRGSVIGYRDRAASCAELEEMVILLKQSLEKGSRGLSTGMPYPPGAYTPKSELRQLLFQVAQSGGVWSTHMASEGDFLLESLEDTINLARLAGVKLAISHLKASGKKNWLKLPSALELIYSARAQGQDIVCDRYPYTASCTDLDILLPSWVWEGGEDRQLERLVDPIARELIVREIGERDWESVVISSALGPGGRELEGKNLEELGKIKGSPPAEVLIDILVEQGLRVEAFFFSMAEENLELVLNSEFCFLASDASARPLVPGRSEGKPHPRAFGTFSRFIERWILTGKLSPGEGIARMTGGPAGFWGLSGRGVITKGAAADLVLIDPDRFSDQADYSDPRRPPQGVEAVLVNGVIACRGGETIGVRPGIFL